MITAMDFSWWNVVPTLVGGAISIVATIAMFRLSQQTDQKKKELESRKQRAANASKALAKLLSAANFILNLDRRIESAMSGIPDAQFASEPFERVGVIFCPSAVSIDISIDEIMFLVGGDTTDLLNKMWEIEYSMKNALEVIDEYNRQFRIYEDYLQQNGEFVGTDDGRPVFRAKETVAAIVDAKAAGLNRLLGEIIMFADEDSKTTQKVFDAAFKRAKDEFGDLIPMKGVNWGKLPC